MRESKKKRLLILLMFMLISISSCEKTLFKKYENEVDPIEFIELFKEGSEKTIFKEYEQNDFYYLVEMVTVLEKVDIDGNIEKKNIINRTELEHDVDNLVLKEIKTNKSEVEENVNVNEKKYYSSLDNENYKAVMEVPLDDFLSKVFAIFIQFGFDKTYIDNKTYTLYNEINDHDYTSRIYKAQVTFKDSSVVFVSQEKMKSFDNTLKEITIRYELRYKNINLK